MTPDDDAHFAAYVAARRDQVRRTAFLLCGDWHRADDLTQQAFVALYRSWTRIRDRAALDSYVHTCLTRAAIDFSRRPWRREQVGEVVEDIADPSDVASLVADRQLVRAALAAVPPRQRAALVLRYYSGLDIAGTAAALGCAEGTVKSQVSRGLQALRRALERAGEHSDTGEEVSGSER